MDVLSPDLMWIEGRCYRVPIIDPAFSRNIVPNLKDCDLEGEEGMDCDEANDDDDVPDIKIEPNGRYCMIFPVARSFLPFIIGSKGATVKRISSNTSCVIFTPKMSDRESNIEIYGPTKNQIILAWKSILVVIKSSRKKLSVTHFICIPLNSEEIKQNFIKFKENILSTCFDQGISEKLFQLPNKLHLTILVLVLVDDKERKQAEESFLKICNKIVKPMLENVKPCIVEVNGLDIMNDDPSEVRVLYANASIKNEETLLQDICRKIRQGFSPLGFNKEDSVPDVKLHVTLMNSAFLNRDEDGNEQDSFGKLNRNDKRTEKFNASEILKVRFFISPNISSFLNFFGPT
ncbi:UNVERIFIED_CONTAM: hypothetical protein PYX00_006866 [Menopon gallinae]|uniref:K Homology domain-containing protein n=1 Tax=Menopon gallinae TaxID=328185 RepID=A0AAW2HY27_9NEOP